MFIVYTKNQFFCDETKVTAVYVYIRLHITKLVNYQHFSGMCCTDFSFSLLKPKSACHLVCKRNSKAARTQNFGISFTFTYTYVRLWLHICIVLYFMFVYVYSRVCMCVCARMYACVCVHAWMYVCVCIVCMCVYCMYMCVCLCLSVRTNSPFSSFKDPKTDKNRQDLPNITSFYSVFAKKKKNEQSCVSYL
jgi:hypothetical protein